MWCISAFAIIGCVPLRGLRYYLNDRAFKITFRIITRSLTSVITFHDEHNKPKNCGFCVANHTSPIDIAILSTDCSFSLVRLQIYTNNGLNIQIFYSFWNRFVFGNFVLKICINCLFVMLLSYCYFLCIHKYNFPTKFSFIQKLHYFVNYFAE